MAKKIEWTESSLSDRIRIYNFWKEQSKSSSYSDKLDKLFINGAMLISEFPEIGTDLNYRGMKVKIIKGYNLFYLTTHDSIQIIRIWDSRRNPETLEL